MFFLTVTIDHPLQGHTDLHRRRGRMSQQGTACGSAHVPQDRAAICGTGKEERESYSDTVVDADRGSAVVAHLACMKAQLCHPCQFAA